MTGKEPCSVHAGDSLPQKEGVAFHEDVAIPETLSSQEVQQVFHVLGGHPDAALQASEARYRRITEGLTDYLYSVRVENGRAVETTQGYACQAVTGYSEEDFCADPYLWINMVVPEDRDLVRNHVQRILKGEEIPPIEHRIQRKDGAIRWMCDTTILFKDAMGNLLSYDGVVKDITERKCTEQKLRESEERYRSLVISANDGIALQDRSGRILTWNKEAERIFGVSTEDIVGKISTEQMWKTYHEDGMEFQSTEHPSIQTLATGVPCHNIIMKVVRASGEFSWISINTSPICREGNPEPSEVVITFSDITERKQAEIALRVVAESGVAPGEDIFRFLARHLAVSQNKRYAMIACVDPGSEAMVHTVALWNSGNVAENMKRYGYFATEVSVWGHGGFANNFSYALDDSPCRNVVSMGTFFYPANVQELFPQNRLLKEMGVESYWGIALHDTSGNVLGLLAILDDKPMEENTQTLSLLKSFATRASAEMDRRRSEEKYQTLFNEMMDGFALHEILCDEAGHPVNYRFLVVNPAFERMTGLQAENIIGKTVLEVIPDLEKHWIEIYGHVALTGESAYFENYSQSMGKYFEVKAFPAQRNRFACIFTDITARKQADETILKMRDLLNETQRLAKVGGWEFRTDTNQMTWTDGVFDIFDLMQDYDPNQIYDFLQFFALEDRALLNHAFLCAVSEGEPYDLELKIVTKLQRKRWVRTTGCVEKIGDDVLRVYGNIMDITDRIAAQEERGRLEDQLRQSQKMEAIGQLAGGVAHDFNNMLQIILCNTDVLKGALEQNTVHGELLSEMCQAAERATDLTRQLLVFSRRQILRPTNLNLNDLIHSELKMIRRIIGENIELLFIPGDHLGVVYADKGQIEQILMNLCVNSRDAMPNGGILTIETNNVVIDDTYQRFHPCATMGRYVLLRVTDTGHGMDAEVCSQIFEPFFTTKEAGKGTGLGLATVYGIVKQHNGMIQVYSEPGKGTAFKIHFPIVERMAEDVGVKIEAPAVGGTETILVAEDEVMVRNLVSHILESEGYTVLMARDGEEALQLFEEYATEIDLVLLDVMMPKLGGRDVMEAIQANGSNVRFLFSSGYSENALHTNFVLEEGLHLISKPYRKKALLDIVREVLDAPASQ